MNRWFPILFLCLMADWGWCGPKLEVSRFDQGKFRVLDTFPLEEGTRQVDGIGLKIKRIERNKLVEYQVTPQNNGDAVARLRFRLQLEGGKTGGTYWDGFEHHREVKNSIVPGSKRYNFPLTAYLDGTQLRAIGFSPSVVSSRFERECRVSGDQVTLFFDHYLALLKGEQSPFSLVVGEIDGADHCVEAVEQVYCAYPENFRPRQNTDERIYGVGGYFFSSPDHRLQQLEEARRFGFDWEWYYNCYQKAGDFYPEKAYWDPVKGYKTEKAHAACDTPGSIEDWKSYNRTRIAQGNRTSAMLYYYLQQYCNSQLLAGQYADSRWVDAQGKPGYKSHGWAEEGWAEYAWPGRQGGFGQKVRRDLGKLWQEFDLSGFALDCALGDTRYYGELALAEPGKAFDENGNIYAVEGTALAYNMDYTGSLPPKADGRVAASVINEPYHYLPAFHCDAAIHEMPPFDRIDVIAPRRMMLGQKPSYWWKGFRIDSLLRWKDLSSREIHEGISGVIKYTILATLRYGAVPAIFYERGFEDMVRWRPIFVELQRLGWRAAPYAVVQGVTEVDPYAADALYWISRFGDGENSAVVLSSPDAGEKQGVLQIRTARFGASGAVYAATDGREIVNIVKPEATEIKFVLKNHQPLILRKVAVRPPGNYRTVENEDKQVLINGQKSGQMEPQIQYSPELLSWISAGGPVNTKSKTTNCTIVGKKEEIAAIGVPAEQLMVYFEYYFTRRLHSYQRLWGMDNRWLTSYRMTSREPDDATGAEKPYWLVLGQTARAKYFPNVQESDSVLMRNLGKQTVIGFFPGRFSESELLNDFLKQLDRGYPFFGGIAEAWGGPARLYGKKFAIDELPTK